MPTLILRTNIKLSQIPADFNQKTTDLIAIMLDKPSTMTMVCVIPNSLVTFGGTTEPCGIATLYSIGNISQDENKEHCKTLHQHFEKELGIPEDRLFIMFVDLDKNNLGWKSVTFDDILK